MARTRWYVELYPMFNSISRFVRPDGSVARFKHLYDTKREAVAAEAKFYKGPHRGLTMDHVLFVDKEVPSTNLRHHIGPVDEYGRE